MSRIKMIAYAFLSAIVFSSCATVQLNSKWSKQNIEIDGLDNEWSGSYNFLKDEKMAFGVRNDSEYLYLVFKTIDNQVKQKIFSNGLTVWIDPSADEEKSFGIHYPIGMMDWNKSQLYDPADWGTPEEREKRLKEKSKIMLKEFEIISSVGRNQFEYSLGNPYNINFALKDTNGTFVYEMKIPLTSPIGSISELKIIPGSKINVGIETGEIDKQSMMDKKSSGGMMGGGKGGGMMGKGGGMGRGNQSAMKDMLEPIKFWVSLSLADGNKTVESSDAQDLK